MDEWMIKTRVLGAGSPVSWQRELCRRLTKGWRPPKRQLCQGRSKAALKARSSRQACSMRRNTRPQGHWPSAYTLAFWCYLSLAWWIAHSEWDGEKEGKTALGRRRACRVMRGILSDKKNENV